MRLGPPIRIAAAHVWIPDKGDRVDRAVAEGRASAEEAERDGFLELLVETELHPPEMAVQAAIGALAEAGLDSGSLDLLIHAWTHHQGLDFWSPAHYITREIEARNAVPVGIQQMCNGGAMAIELAASRLLVEDTTRHALITTADRFTAPEFDRWRSDYGIAYGDAATAIVLGGEQGPWQLTAITTTAASELEPMHRGEEPFEQSTADNDPLDIRSRKRAFMQANGRERFTELATRCTRRVVERSLRDADGAGNGTRPRLVLLPRLGAAILDSSYRPALNIKELGQADVVWAGAYSGHLGAGDLAANLAELESHSALEPGDTVLLISAGGGFTWTCLVLERLRATL